MSTEIVAVRHGETLWNAERRIQGQEDSDLSELGLSQAKAIAASLSTERVDAVYSSDLKRAFRTAAIIAEEVGTSVITDPRLRERHYGILQGLTIAEIRERYADEWDRYRSRDEDTPIPGGESLRERHLRVVSCLDEIADGHPDERLVIVAHGGVLDSLFRHAVGVPLSAPRGFQIHNAARSLFERRNGKWLLVTWGDLTHLDSLRSDWFQRS